MKTSNLFDISLISKKSTPLLCILFDFIPVQFGFDCIENLLIVKELLIVVAWCYIVPLRNRENLVPIMIFVSMKSHLNNILMNIHIEYVMHRSDKLIHTNIETSVNYGQLVL